MAVSFGEHRQPFFRTPFLGGIIAIVAIISAAVHGIGFLSPASFLPPSSSLVSSSVPPFRSFPNPWIGFFLNSVPPPSPPFFVVVHSSASFPFFSI
jgi:hypothetical protein